MKNFPWAIRAILTICIAEIFALVGVFTFPALLPVFSSVWMLSAIESGWINGIYFAGYLISVPILVSLTDRIPAKRVYLFAIVISAVSSLGFALLTDGFWGAMFFRALGGIGLAGSYMPGLKLLTDVLDLDQNVKDNSRAITFYTTSFGLGVAFSYFLAGIIESSFGWKITFGVASIGPLIAGLLVLYLLKNQDQNFQNRPVTRLLDFRPVLRSREAMGYVLAYTVHNFELFAFRSWMVAFFVYSASTHANQTLILSATAWAAISSLLGLPFSVLGNELSKRIGRHRAITILMWLSAVIAGGLGFAAELPFTIVVALTLVYGVLVTAESPSITAGLINAAPTGYRGATMAVHSCIGFIGSFLGPVAFGFVLEMVGSTGNITFAWGWAFFMCGIIVALGPIFLFICRPLDPQ